jgi:hypothetical protein
MTGDQMAQFASEESRRVADMAAEAAGHNAFGEVPQAIQDRQENLAQLAAQAADLLKKEGH